MGAEKGTVAQTRAPYHYHTRTSTAGQAEWKLLSGRWGKKKGSGARVSSGIGLERILGSLSCGLFPKTGKTVWGGES